VGPKAVLDAVIKRKISHPHWESNPRTPIIQPVDHNMTMFNFIFYPGLILVV